MNDSTIDYSKVFTELIQKEMVLIGPDITFGIIKKVGGIHVDQYGVVMQVDASDPKSLLTSLLNEFFSLSDLIAQKGLEILLDNYPELPIDPKNYGVSKKVDLPPALTQSPQVPSIRPQTSDQKQVSAPKTDDSEGKKSSEQEKSDIANQTSLEKPQSEPIITPTQQPTSAVVSPLVMHSKPTDAHQAQVLNEEKKEDKDFMQKIEKVDKKANQTSTSEFTTLGSEEDEKKAAQRINEFFA